VTVTGWNPLVTVTGWNPPVTVTSTSLDPESEPASFSCEPFDGLKLLFKKKMPKDKDKSPP
jgi:hypothetical protein